MENWIFISIFGLIVGVNSHTIIYPGKSALLSYSPARGEFPVESLFGRGFFNYIDNHGISRTVNLEPNPLLGIRVGDNGKLTSDLGNTVRLSNGDGGLINHKEDRLKPIKEFDERPYEDSLDLEKDVSLLSASIVDSSSKIIEGSEQTKENQKSHQQILSITIPKQQDQLILYPKTGTVLAEGLGLQPDNTYWISQNTPSKFSGNPIASKPFVQGVFNSENPFLNQHLGLQVQNPSTASNLGPVPQNILLPLPGQIFFYPPTESISSEAFSTSSSPASQATTGQVLLPPKPNIPEGIVSSTSEMTEINSANNQLVGISSEAVLPNSNEFPSISSGAILSQGSQAQVLANPPIVSTSPSSQVATINSDSSQQTPDQSLGQAVSYPTVPISSVASLPSSSHPVFGSTLSPIPQPSDSYPVPPTPAIPVSGLFPGNPFFSASSYPSAAPLQEVFMIHPTNPFLSLNNKDKPVSWPKPIIATTTAPVFNADQKNPFLSNSLKNNVKLEVPTVQGQSIAVKPNRQLEAVLPTTIACDYHSVSPAPEHIKDTPEVEKAKREHFLAHKLALEQLTQARQNNDNTDQANESSLTLASTSDSSPSYLTANAPLDQPVTSGPTMIFEQTTVKSVESEIATLQPLPVKK